MLSSNRTGSFYMLLSVICFSLMDILVKLTTSNYPIGEIAFFRGLFGLIPIFFLIPKEYYCKVKFDWNISQFLKFG